MNAWYLYLYSVRIKSLTWDKGVDYLLELCACLYSKVIYVSVMHLYK